MSAPVITKTSLAWEPQPLRGAFGFKGGSLTELWQVRCFLATDSGLAASGRSVQSVLWSDGAVFARWGERAGNERMLALTRYALELLEGMALSPPPEMLQVLLPAVLERGRALTEADGLRATFALNALTGIDWALWKLWRLHTGCPGFDALTAPYRAAAPIHAPALGVIPLLSYDTPEEQILSLAEQGCFLFKIKIGADPDGRGDREQMLRWDAGRLAQIHRLLQDRDTPWTDCGHPVYYLDANGRYDTAERVERLLDAADRMGALERIVLLEEPFPEDAPQDVRRLPVAVAGDESAHSAADAARLMDRYGYRVMALKPIAKTVSVSLEVLQAAQERGAACFCADLTVHPAMAELSKRFAAGLAPLPGLRVGVFETNGAQNYVNWKAMRRQSPAWGRPWEEPRDGLYRLDGEYYRTDGEIWTEE